MRNPTHVIFHGACPDGFGAAWAVWKKIGNQAQYLPGFYNKPYPKLPADSRVLIVDYSFASRQDAIAFHNSVYEVQLVDHHQTAMDMLGDLPWCKFDMDHSGAYLAWEHMHDEEPPELIKYVEDRDLWRFQLPYSREVAAALGSYPRDFVVWESVSEMGMEKMKLDGGTILRFQSQKVSEICENAFWKEIDGYRVPVVNTSVLTSEVGDRLCQTNPTVPFAGYFFVRSDGKTQWGLRSPGRTDVSIIAKKFGGGGHKGAAGFVEAAK